MEDREQLLQRLEKALLRMEQQGFKDTKHYENLKSKYKEIKGGANYQVRDVTKECIATMGGLISSCNAFWGGRSKTDAEIIKGIEEGLKTFKKLKKS